MNRLPSVSPVSRHDREASDIIDVPRARNAVLVERLLWVFMLSFSLDYLAAESRQGGGGAGIDQLLFLLLCVSSTAGIVALGWRSLLTRPGARLILFWGAFIFYLLANSVVQGVSFGRSLRVILPFGFCLFGMINAHIAGCMGVRPSQILRPVFVAACINVPWRLFQGLYIQKLDIETVRFQIQSPGSNWLATFIPCALLLRGKFHWSLLVACAVLFSGIFITVTRSMLFPIFASFLAAGICFLLGVRWRIYPLSALWVRLMPVAVAAVFMLLVAGFAALALPATTERWTERLFHNADSINLTADISYLTRRAEADGILKDLKSDPVHFINGRGIGASYNWDLAYMPEINLVIPSEGEPLGTDMWFAGHSTWTYALFSGGVIGVVVMVAFFISVMASSLIAARLNATEPGPDQWLAFLPFIVIFSLMSETLTSNPLHERLAGMIIGMMAGLSQSSFVRASWIHMFPGRPLPRSAPSSVPPLSGI